MRDLVARLSLHGAGKPVTRQIEEFTDTYFVSVLAVGE